MTSLHAGNAQGSQPVGPLPADCLTLLDRRNVSGLATWQATVALEHCDRIKRLQRLSLILPPDERPQFFEAIIPRERLPSSYNVDIPVLRVVFPDRVFFDTAKSTLRPEAREIASIMADSLRREPPDVTLFVAGHADSRGGSDFNEQLSISRADAVATEIFRNGINLGTVWRIGFGEDMPLLAGEDEAAWGQNRRIEFLFSAKPEPIGAWLSDQQLPGLCQSRNASESERCRARLQLRSGYEAARVDNLDARTRKRRSPSGKRQSVAVAPARLSTAPAAEERATDRAPGPAAKADLAPAQAERAVLIPKSAPRLVINPVNRQVDAVSIQK
ncbi:MAG: OmpA family protein [Parvularcula sp.]|nr:OmpA family protein [Parvularcula sp.]